MRTWGILVLLGACFATLDQASGFGEWTEREQHPAKCARMFPSSWNWIGKYATHCRYLCRTFPPHYEDEEDKTPCMVSSWNTTQRRQGGRIYTPLLVNLQPAEKGASLCIYYVRT
ncbi:unnamed protein product [Ixodes persulcatus]